MPDPHTTSELPVVENFQEITSMEEVSKTTKSKSRPDLDKLIAKAKRKMQEIDPVERERMMESQRQSWKAQDWD